MRRRWLAALLLALALTWPALAADKLPDVTGPELSNPPTQAAMNQLRRAINQNFLLNDGGNAAQTALGGLLAAVSGKLYGMKCDGGTDDTVAFQNAINAAQALAFPGTSNGGAILYLPPGFCMVSGSPAVTVTSGIMIVGSGVGLGNGAGNSGGTVIRHTSASGDAIAVRTNSPVVFSNLYIDSASYKTDGACISLTGNSGGSLNNYNFRSRINNITCRAAYDGIRIDEGGDVAVTNSSMLDYGRDGIRKVNATNPDVGEDKYTNLTLQNLNRGGSGTEANNPFTTTNGSSTVTVSHAAHGLVTGMMAVFSGAAVFNNVTIVGEYSVTVVDANSFTITAGTNANASGAGGGAAVLYAYKSRAGFEYLAGGDISIANTKLIGNCYNFLINATYGPTGTMRLTGNSLEEASCSHVMVKQGTSGVEQANLVVVGNQFSNLGTRPSKGTFYIGAGTPTSAAKWFRNVSFVGNVTNDALSVSGPQIQVLDGDNITIAGNSLDNNNVAGPTAISIASAATNVLEYGNVAAGYPTGKYGTILASALNLWRTKSLVQLGNGTASSSPTTGDLVVDGGLGVGGALFGASTGSFAGNVTGGTSSTYSLSMKGAASYPSLGASSGASGFRLLPNDDGIVAAFRGAGTSSGVTLSATDPSGGASYKDLTLNGTTVAFAVSAANAFTIDTNKHFQANGAPPSLTSCGTLPTIAGSDYAGEVTMGTGTPTGCVITFAAAYAGVPYCTVTWQATPLASQSYTVSATAITLTQTATSSNKVNYNCTARSGG